MDYYWMLRRAPQRSDWQKSRNNRGSLGGSSDAELSERRGWTMPGSIFEEYKLREGTHCEPRCYNLLAYTAYCLYIPLYLTGPMITYNAFVSQIYRPMRIPWRPVLQYGCRVVVWFFATGLLLRYSYYYGILTSSKVLWISMAPWQVCYVAGRLVLKKIFYLS